MSEMIKEINSLQEFIRNGNSLERTTVKQVDFTGLDIHWGSIKIGDTVFLGCTFPEPDRLHLFARGAYIYEAPGSLPYRPFRKNLYTWQELESGQGEPLDLQIYKHFYRQRRNPSINEALWQRMHDHAIDDALRDFIGMQDNGLPDLKCVGIMGGHGVSRTDPTYLQTARTAKKLAENGYLVVSGGGPGIMEAANLGAYLAGHSDRTIDDAIEWMSDAPRYEDAGFMELAKQCWKRMLQGKPNLAIPTWFYGHEPSNVFATQIAKYFSNSIREDTLLAICLWGVIFAPGSAGTLQEIFMDASQNHYGTFGYYSPMVFIGSDHYQHDSLIFPTLKRLARGRTYEQFLHVTDDPDDVVHFIKAHPPLPVTE